MDLDIKFQYTQEDMKEFQIVHTNGPAKLGSVRAFRIAVRWIAPILALIIFFILFHQEPSKPGASLSASTSPGSASLQVEFLVRVVPWLMMFAAIGSVLFLLWRRRLRKDPRLAEWREWRISDESVTQKMQYANTTMAWQHFVRFTESKNLFILYESNQTAFLVPKRAFTSAGDVDAFRKLVEERVGQVVGGFPVQPKTD